MVSIHTGHGVAHGPWTIKAVGAFTPPAVVHNAEIEDRLGLDSGWIENRTGIRERRHADPGTAAEDLAVPAARRALAAAGVTAERLGGLVFATSSPSRVVPGLGYLLQHRLGASRATVLDVNTGCSGFLHAVHLACTLGTAGQFDGPVLVVGAECFSPYLDPYDRATSVLFGDGAGAAVLGPGPGGSAVLCSALGSDGFTERGAWIRLGGKGPGGATVHMDGRFVADYVRGTFGRAAQVVLDHAGSSLDEVDLVVFHQANVALLRQVAAEYGIPTERVPLSGDRYGNTGAASIPLTLDLHRHRLTPGAQVLLFALGGGMNWAGTLVRIGEPTPGSRP
ncbi:ketoacyl-ACP synthase III [Streptomyces sp. NPDC000594]|uniref:3-oxoacyl-ACP synthase III family protein n=1 Tax=Streptomyces sp. NPDC000594 TaxID=3154261 RepID=UPI0033339CAA